MGYSCRLQYIKGLSLAFAMLFFVLGIAKAEKADIRLLVDLSEKNQEALRKQSILSFVKHVPNGSYAGIWSYGKYVNLVVKPGVVNAEWRKKALASVDKLMVTSKYSNLADAIENATYDWDKMDASVKKRLVLLSDGHIFVSTNARENAAERQYVKQIVIPRLKAENVTVYSISPKWKSDFELLNDLASVNNGWVKQAKNGKDINWAVYLGVSNDDVALARRQEAHTKIHQLADNTMIQTLMNSSKELTKMPVKGQSLVPLMKDLNKEESVTVPMMAEKKAVQKPESTPPETQQAEPKNEKPNTLHISTFTVTDKDTSLFAVIHHRENAKFELVSPSGDAYHAEFYKTSMDWTAGETYDTVTIKSPEKGEWKLVGLEPTDKWSVLYSPKLATKIPSDTLFHGENIDVAFALEMSSPPQGEPIVDSLSLSWSHSIAGSTKLDKNAHLDANHMLNVVLKEPQFDGFHRVVATLSGYNLSLGTQAGFKVVANPFVLNESFVNQNTKEIETTITANTAIVVPESLTYVATFKSPEGTISTVSFNDASALMLPQLSDGGAYEVKFEARGKTIKQRDFVTSLGVHKIPEAFVAPEPTKDSERVVSTEPANTQAASPEAVAPSQAETGTEEKMEPKANKEDLLAALSKEMNDKKIEQVKTESKLETVSKKSTTKEEVAPGAINKSEDQTGSSAESSAKSEPASSGMGEIVPEPEPIRVSSDEKDDGPESAPVAVEPISTASPGGSASWFLGIILFIMINAGLIMGGRNLYKRYNDNQKKIFNEIQNEMM